MGWAYVAHLLDPEGEHVGVLYSHSLDEVVLAAEGHPRASWCEVHGPRGLVRRYERDAGGEMALSVPARASKRS